MKILITGGAGFQGSHLAEALGEQGHEVSILNTPSQQARRNYHNYLEGKINGNIWGSVTDGEIVDKSMAGMDTVFHLAAHINVDESIENPIRVLEINYLGTFNILEAARRHGIRVIYGSSCEVYGTPRESPIIESTELSPHSPYAASKAAADRLCFAYSATYGVNIQIARLFNVFGERQKEGKFGAVIPIFVSQAMAGKSLTVFGTGEQTRDYVYVQDAVSAYLKVLNRPVLGRGETFNFATGVPRKIGDIAEFIGQHFKVRVNYVQGRPGEVTDMIGSYSKARSLLDWRPEIDFFVGLRKYINWRQSGVAEKLALA